MIDLQIADALLAQQLDLLRLEAGVRDRVLALLNNLQGELKNQLLVADLTDFSRQRVSSLLAQATEVIDRYYSTINTVTTTTLEGVVPITTRATAAAIEAGLTVALRAAVPSTPVVNSIFKEALIFGAKSKQWWGNQSRDVAFRYGNAVRAGIAANESIEQIVSRVSGTSEIKGVMDVSRANARGLVHSSVMTVANDSRMATYEKNKDLFTGFAQLSTLDGHTTDICIAYSGAQWDLEFKPIKGNTLPYNNGCPRHWGCRSLIIPTLKSYKQLGINLPEPGLAQIRASTFGPIAADTSFSSFLKRRTRQQVEEQLGKGRADLWRSGKISLRQLLDFNGNPLTLSQLESKYGKR